MSTVEIFFTSFIPLNGNNRTTKGPNKKVVQAHFSGQLEVGLLETKTPRTGYDLSLHCRNGLTPKQFLISSVRDTVILDTNDKGTPNHFLLISKEPDGKFRFKVEFDLDENGDPSSLKFYLPPNGIPVDREQAFKSAESHLGVALYAFQSSLKRARKINRF